MVEFKFPYIKLNYHRQLFLQNLHSLPLLKMRINCFKSNHLKMKRKELNKKRKKNMPYIYSNKWLQRKSKNFSLLNLKLIE